jgi:lipopolysaccharide transport system ATP-binding protein
MNDFAIRIEDLGKRYRIGELNHHRSLREQLLRCCRAPWVALRSRPTPETAEPAQSPHTLWALRDFSLEIPRGQVVGFVGRNGAGKSTLLKLLTRITQPTTGRAELRGRMGSLLEVGTGFHPELTGRENVYLNGAILGMTRSEIRRNFDEIVEFAGVGPFLDTPVKRYSSGMAVRLAFAVAAHLDAEILIVDEVLAVGDAEFQRRCLGKMNDVARRGRTVLFVSHNMQAVGSLCHRAICLEAGRMTMDGPAAEVVRDYLGASASAELDRRWDDPATAPGNEWIRLHRIRLVRDDGGDPQRLELDTPFRLEFSYWNLRPETRLNLSMHLKTMDDVTVFASTTIREPQWHGRAFPAGLFTSVCHVPGRLLNDGRYSLDLYFVKDCATPVYIDRSAFSFDVHEFARDADWFGKWVGVVRPELAWTTELFDEDRAGRKAFAA